jgi:hypothetical protein
MNWKNVLRLVNVNIKSYRVVRGTRFRRFRENKMVTYALYIGACVVGVLAGWLIGNFYSGVSDLELRTTIFEGAKSLFISLPTIALLYGIVLTQISQFQRIGAKVSIQPVYWFPITWKEHTLASILANLLGVPLIITAFISSGIFVASIFLGLVPLAVLTIFALLTSIILASVTTEVFKTLQVRLSGAMTKIAGRAAIWIRFLGSIGFFIVFYLIYFSMYYSTTPIAIIEWVAGGQGALWFIPYLWLGTTLFSFANSLWVEAIVFFMASLSFLYAIFLVATRLNRRFGMYEMPSIKVSRGVYTPKTGLFGKLGFSPEEAAIMRKDFKSFTRRHELMYIFIFPIIFVIIPIFTTLRIETGAGNPMPAAFPSFMFAYLTMLPGTLMAVTIGSMIIGSEGESVWYLYSSPVSAKSFVKAKYAFVILFSLAVTLICSIISGVLLFPSPEFAIISVIEAAFLLLSLTTVSLNFGIRGADFRELFPRPRMIRPKWGIINFIVCVITGLAIVAPIVPYILNYFFGAIGTNLAISIPLPEYYVYIALILSGAIAAIITYVFRKMALNNAERLLAESEGI